MMNACSDHIILGYLRNLLQELGRKLIFPKNDWKRRKELLAEIQDVKKRILVFENNSGLLPLSTPCPQIAADSDRSVSDMGESQRSVTASALQPKGADHTVDAYSR